MSLRIEGGCISCDMCEPECPNHAISNRGNLYFIDPKRCTECVGHYDAPQCKKACPIHCITSDPNHSESSADLLTKFQRLYPTSHR